MLIILDLPEQHQNPLLQLLKTDVQVVVVDDTGFLIICCRCFYQHDCLYANGGFSQQSLIMFVVQMPLFSYLVN